MQDDSVPTQPGMTNPYAAKGQYGNTFYSLTPNSVLKHGWQSPVGEHIAKALVKAQAMVKDAAKSGDNKFDKYNYSKLEDFLAACDQALQTCELALTMETVEAHNMPDRETKNGGREHAVQVCVKGRLIHSSGEELVVHGYGQGQDRADKAIYKAITGAKKYLVGGLLKIATTDDPEADETVGLAGKGNAQRQKLDSAGNEQTKIPKWTDIQKTNAGLFNADILKLLTTLYNGNDKSAMDELSNWKTTHKYDAPEVVLEALARWKTELTGTEA